MKNNKKTFFFFQIVKGAGHHVYADQAGVFNDLVNRISRKVDLQNGVIPETIDLPPKPVSSPMADTESENAQPSMGADENTIHVEELKTEEKVETNRDETNLVKHTESTGSSQSL